MSYKGLLSAVTFAIVLLSVMHQLLEGSEPKTTPQSGQLRIGAYALDVTPMHYPVIVNGMFEERTADRDVDPLFARAFVFDAGGTRIAIVVVDSCMMPRELL